MNAKGYKIEIWRKWPLVNDVAINTKTDKTITISKNEYFFLVIVKLTIINGNEAIQVNDPILKSRL